jgi:hypothetical protein
MAGQGRIADGQAFDLLRGNYQGEANTIMPEKA